MSVIMMLNIIHRQTIPSTVHMNWLQNHKLIITVVTCGLVFSHLIGYLAKYFWCSPLSRFDCKFSNAGICSLSALTFLFLLKTWRGCGQNVTQEFA